MDKAKASDMTTAELQAAIDVLWQEQLPLRSFDDKFLPLSNKRKRLEQQLCEQLQAEQMAELQAAAKLNYPESIELRKRADAAFNDCNLTLYVELLHEVATARAAELQRLRPVRW